MLPRRLPFCVPVCAELLWIPHVISWRDSCSYFMVLQPQVSSNRLINHLDPMFPSPTDPHNSLPPHLRSETIAQNIATGTTPSSVAVYGRASTNVEKPSQYSIHLQWLLAASSFKFYMPTPWPCPSIGSPDSTIFSSHTVPHSPSPV